MEERVPPLAGASAPLQASPRPSPLFPLPALQRALEPLLLLLEGPSRVPPAGRRRRWAAAAAPQAATGGRWGGRGWGEERGGSPERRPPLASGGGGGWARLGRGAGGGEAAAGGAPGRTRRASLRAQQRSGSCGRGGGSGRAGEAGAAGQAPRRCPEGAGAAWGRRAPGSFPLDVGRGAQFPSPGRAQGDGPVLAPPGRKSSKAGKERSPGGEASGGRLQKDAGGGDRVPRLGRRRSHSGAGQNRVSEPVWENGRRAGGRRSASCGCVQTHEGSNPLPLDVPSKRRALVSRNSAS